MSTVLKVCLNCGQQFQASLREHKRGNAKFCGRSCASKYQVKNVLPPPHNCECAECGTTFYRSRSKLSNSKSGLHFCSRACKDKAQRINGMKEIQPPHYGTGDGTNTYREVAFHAYDHECAHCGYDEHMEGLDVHHINHDRTDNRIENLVILCCLCHRLLHRGLLDSTLTNPASGGINTPTEGP